MSKTKAEADDAPVPTHSNETKPEMSAHENVDNGNGSVTQDHKQIRTEEEAIAQNHIAALQTHEAEIRRQEEETALIQAGFMINQKIRACRQQIFSAMQRLQVCSSCSGRNQEFERPDSLMLFPSPLKKNKQK
jgi:hypothetical protein